MKFCLCGRGQAFGKEVGIEIACQEQKLEDKHVGGPNGGGTSEPREDVFADDELHLKEEKGAEKDGGGERPDDVCWRRRERRFPGQRGGFECGSHARSVAWAQGRAKFMRHMCIVGG